jgi:hypothetical protein
MFNDSLAAETRLADQIEAASTTIVARSLEYMPSDEFWERRYGARGNRFAREDGAFHLRYLADALRAGSPTVMAEYGRWLRDLLVPRGMCTLHLAEHLEHLAQAVELEDGAERAQRYMRAGIDALTYPNETPAAAVQRWADAIAHKVTSLPVPSGSPRNSAWETRYLCHYAADALARVNADLLTSHLEWARNLYRDDHQSPERFDFWVEEVSTALAALNIPGGFLPSTGIHR